MTTEVADRMATEAIALLRSLDETQAPLAAWPLADDAERRRWFYTPTDHGGLTLAYMHPGQQQLTHRLVSRGLSRPGYTTVATIIGLDNILDELEGWVTSWGRERGRDPGLYYIRIFGDPASGTWAWRFGGHHVSINFAIADGIVVGSTPNFLGADPANSPVLGPDPLRPLAGAEDLGRELVRSLSDEQLQQALLAPVAPMDLVSANRSAYGQRDGDLPLSLSEIWRGRFDGDIEERLRHTQAQAERGAGLLPEHLEAVRLTMEPKGLSARFLRRSQRELLRTLLEVYARRLPDGLVESELAKFGPDEALDDLSFAWAGSLEPGVGHYYRVQGSRLLAEYDNTQRGANHIHTVWRDPRRDFGGDLLGAHYAGAHAKG